LDKCIKDMLIQCDRIDEVEEGSGSLVTMDKELKDQNILESKVKTILKELEKEK
jgi:hypothetical protein